MKKQTQIKNKRKKIIDFPDYAKEKLMYKFFNKREKQNSLK